MNHDLSVIARLAADRQYAFRSSAALGQPGGHHAAPRNDFSPLQRSFARSRPRRPAWGRRWPT
jgi:hypothetical protein